jgi:putative oxidoreductase
MIHTATTRPNHLWSSVSAALLILLFAYAAMSKLLDLPAFSGQLHNQSFSPFLADVLEWLVPASELVACGLLLSAVTRWYGMVLSLCLMVAFTAYITLVLMNFWTRVPCSCGGVISHLSWTGHFWFNLFFLITAVIGLLTTPRIPVR